MKPQKAVQSTVSLSQYYEKQLDAVTSKMAKMEKLLMTQTQKSTTLEGQLSAAQDRIGGAERRAKLLEDENVRIHSELEYWNELYSQETGVTPPQTGQEVNSPPSVAVSADPTVPSSVSSLIMGYENVASGSGPISASMSIPQSVVDSRCGGPSDTSRFDVQSSCDETRPCSTFPHSNSVNCV